MVSVQFLMYQGAHTKIVRVTDENPSTFFILNLYPKTESGWGMGFQFLTS